MGITKQNLRDADVYLEYDFEDVLFRYEASTRKCYCRFLRNTNEVEVPHSDSLLNDALLFGKVITAEEYRRACP